MKTTIHVRSSSRLSWAAIGLASLVLAAGCATASAGTNASTAKTSTTTPTLSGQVVVEGGPPVTTGNPDGSRPLPHTRVVIAGETADQVHVVRHLTTDTHGKFSAALPDGTYTVTAITYVTGFKPGTEPGQPPQPGPPRPLADQPHQTIAVTNGALVKVQLIAYVV